MKNSADELDTDGCLRLVGAIIRANGNYYANSPNGYEGLKYWCGLAGLDTDYVFAKLKEKHPKQERL